ncbi:hypothetical protein G7Y79_00001g002960 [Physcia stellaris]|nr:hypothetical protein G7Y79_00001g002960 [Physcia stellaris]
MKLFIATFAFAAFTTVSAQSTVLAACGTACPSGPAPDVTVTRSDPPKSEGTPCPSLIVSSISSNGTNPTASGLTPTASPFTGGASHVGGSLGAALAVVAAALAL